MTTTTTFLFNEGDPRLYQHERKYLRELSVAITRRADVQEYDRCKPADPRALEAQHFKLSRGDL
jgi:hypothetical protein